MLPVVVRQRLRDLIAADPLDVRLDSDGRTARANDAAVEVQLIADPDGLEDIYSVGTADDGPVW
jgi:hypothetical protein